MLGNKVCCSITLREHYYKIQHCLYMTSVKIYKMFPGSLSKCWWCGLSMASHKDMCWTCAKVRLFWRMVGKNIENILGISIPCSLRSHLLHDISELRMGKSKRMLLTNLSMAASLILATNWKPETVPSRDDWLTKVWYLALMCKITA